MRVGVEILTKNRPEYLAMLLDSLRYQTYQDFDVFILDESDNDTVRFQCVQSLLTRLSVEDHYIDIKKNSFTNNIGKSRNVLIERDFNPLHLRIDDDCVVSANYIEALVSTFRNYPNAGAVGGVTPTVGAPNIIRDSSKLACFEEIKFDSEGKISLTDRGGVL